MQLVYFCEAVYSFGVVQLEWYVLVHVRAEEAGSSSVGVPDSGGGDRRSSWSLGAAGRFSKCSCCVLYAALVAVYVLLEQYVVAGCPCSGAARVRAVGGGRGMVVSRSSNSSSSSSSVWSWDKVAQDTPSD